MQQVLRDLRQSCLTELRTEAAARGGNVVIAVRLSDSEFSGHAKGLLMLVASGTAVRVELIDDE